MILIIKGDDLLKNYDFETIIPRYNTGSGKWAEVQRVLGDTPEDVVPFSVADMEFITAPEIREGLKSFIDNSILGYSIAPDRYKDAVVHWMKTKHNWDIQKEWICSAHGVVDAFHLAIKSYTNEGDGVILMTPVYYPMYAAITKNNRVLIENKLVKGEKNYTIDFKDLEDKASDEKTKLLILCSPHNPVGRVWTKDELYKIAEICKKHNVLVISDEIHFDFVDKGYTHIVYSSLSEEVADNSVILTSPSKTFNVAGLQTACVLIKNEALRDRFMSEIKTTAGVPKCNILGYEACTIAYTQGETWLEEAKKIIYKNRDIIVDFLSKEFPSVKVFDLEGTYLLWMDFSSLGINHLELEKIMKHEAHLFFDEGYIFGEEGIGFERWNLACPTKSIEDALIRLKNALKKYI